jgi:hypothetical protein
VSGMRNQGIPYWKSLASTRLEESWLTSSPQFLVNSALKAGLLPILNVQRVVVCLPEREQQNRDEFVQFRE